MNIRIYTDRGKIDLVLPRLIKKLKSVNIINIEKKKNYIASSYNVIIKPNSKTLVSLEKKILDIPYVKKVIIYPIKHEGRKEQPLHKRFTFFVDIDGTITETTSKRINPKTRRIFKKMTEGFRHRIILASGRPNTPVERQMQYLHATPIVIAENGGVIVGMGGNDKLLGDRSECEDAVDFLKGKLPGIREVGEERRAEAIINRKYSANKLSKTLDNEYDVICTDSGTSIHINSTGACKGEAVKEVLDYYPSWTHENTVGIGDSDLDISLFGEVANPIAVHNANQNAKTAAHCTVMNGKNLDGVIEAFRMFESRLTLNF